MVCRATNRLCQFFECAYRMLKPHATLIRTTCVFKSIKGRPWFAVFFACRVCVCHSVEHVWRTCLRTGQGATLGLYVGAALSPLTKSDRRCYFSLEKVTMICRSTIKRSTAGTYSVSAQVRNCTGSIRYTGYGTAACRSLACMHD